MTRKPWIALGLALGLLLGSLWLVPAAPAYAQAEAAWEEPLTAISTSLIGPVALAGFLIALAIFCLMAMAGYGFVGGALALVVFGGVLARATDIAAWLGFGG